MKIFKTALVVQNCIAGDFDKNMETCLGLIAEAVQKGANIIVFPEMNLTGYVAGPDILSIAKTLDKKTIKLFSNLAVRSKITVLVGLAEKKAPDHIYASHLIFNPEGSFDIYRKIHTAPFEKEYFTAGSRVTIANAHGLRFGVQLCYDAHFPELSLAMALKKTDVIFIPHASPRGDSEKKYHSWMRHLSARAFDNGVYIAACNQTGNNAKGLSFPGLCLLIGPDGNVIYKSTDNSEGVHIVEIDKGALLRVRSHKMRYFLPHRRSDLFKI